jgi:hypothetical protein
VIGAHDGAPKGTDGGAGETARWFDRYLGGTRNGVERHRRVRMWLSDGDREDYLGGKFVRRDARDWPPPGTRWESLALDAKHSGTTRSLNDGSLGATRAKRATTQRYPATPSLPTSSDPFNTAIVGGFGPNQLAVAFPVLTEMKLAEPAALTYTTKPLKSDVLSIGPASLELRLSSTASETSMWAVISDVARDGSAHPLTAGRLLSSFPAIDDHKSLHHGGSVVQPYGRFDRKQPASPGKARTYRIELWPLGNRFRAGHRLRLDVLGGSAASKPSAPAVNSVTVGGRRGSRLLVPELGGEGFAGGGCLARRSPVGPRNIGRVRLGLTRRRVLRRVRPRPVRRGRRVYRWCVKRSSGRVSAVFSRRSARGRARLVVTTARLHGMRGVHRGTRVRRLRARFRHRRRLSRGLYRAGPHSRRLFGVRKGRVRFVAVADRKLIRRRRSLSRYLHRAGRR